MVMFSKEVWDTVLDDLVVYHLSSTFCPCRKKISCIVERSSDVTMSQHWVSMRCKILQPMTYGGEFLHGHRLSPLRCAHDCVNNIRLKMSMYQWESIGALHHRFVVLNASVEGDLVNSACTTGGVVKVPTYAFSQVDSSMESSEDGDSNSSQKLTLKVGELFCGGFSGWSHGTSALNTTKYQMEHVWALDSDPFATEIYAKTHQSSAPIHDFGRLISCSADDKTRLFTANVEEHWWITMAAVMSADAVVLSPPCQAWSEASNGPGLNRRDGRAVLHGWGCVGMLRPDVAMMEMVSGMHNHAHFALVKSFIQWMGYDIKAIEVINANQITPQNRDRMLMVAINRFSKSNRAHRFWKWPVQQGPSMQGYQAIVPVCEKWQGAIPSPDIVKQYMDPALLPHGGFGRPAKKRCKKDVNDYRIRLPQDQFACLMASYGFAHEMPSRVLQKGGLYGSLLLHEGVLRFLTEPECVIMQGAVDRQWLTNDRRTNARILGNAIILPHAILGLINVVGYHNMDVDRADFATIFCQAMSQRMKSENICWRNEEGGILFRKKDGDDFFPSTIPIREFAKITIQSPIEAWHCHIEYGVEVREVISILLGPSIPSVISIGVAGNPECRVPLPPSFRADAATFVLRVDLPSALMVPVEKFHTSSGTNQTIVVLTAQGPIALKHQSGMIVDDVLNILKNLAFVRSDEGLQCFSFLGEMIATSCLPSQCMIVSPPSCEHDFDTTWQARVVMIEAEQIFRFKGPSFDLQSFLRFTDVTRCKDILSVLGWHFTQPVFPCDDDNDQYLFLTRIPGALGVLQDDLRVFLSSFFFGKIVQSIKMDRCITGIECSLKMWEQVVWRAHLSSSATFRPIVNAWRAISGFFGKSTHIRLVTRGKTMNPDFPVGDFVPMNPTMSQRSLKIFMVLELHGGGTRESDVDFHQVDPIPSILCSSCDSHHSIVVDHMVSERLAHQCKIAFEETMKSLFQMWMNLFPSASVGDQNPGGKICFAVKEGNLRGVGSLLEIFTFIQFLNDMKILHVFKKMGWFVCPYQLDGSAREEAMVMVQPIPNCRHTCLQSVQTMLQAMFTTIRIHQMCHATNEMNIRIKLWGWDIFDRGCSKSILGKDIVEAWDYACRISGFGCDIRMITKGRRMNPDYQVVEYAHHDQFRPTSMKIHLVVALRGGAPPIKDQQGLQRDAIALLYLSSGHDFKTAADVSHAFCKSASSAAIQKALSQYPEEKKLKAFASLAHSLSIVIPEPTKTQRDTDLKTQAKIKGKGKGSSQTPLNVESLKIKPGYFLNQDASHVIQRPTIVPSSAGVAVMHWQEAKQWLFRAESISQDEVAILVIGDCMGGAMVSATKN